MMHKKYIIVFALCVLSTLAFAQQITTNNHYLHQPFLINPAAAGLSDYNAVHLSHKSQWVGFEDNPVTQSFAYQFKKGTHTAFGLRFVSDQTKSFGTNSAQLNYVFHSQLSPTTHFALATGLEIGQLKNSLLNQVVVDPTDPVLFQEPVNKAYLNSNFSFFLQGEKVYVGMSLPKLFSENYLNSVGEEVALGSRGLLLNGGYLLPVSSQLALEPSILFSKDEYTPPSMRLSLKAIYQDFMNLSFSLKDFSGVMAGFGFDYKQFMLGYYYSIPTQDLSVVSGASHELLLSYKWTVRPVAPKKKRIRKVKEPKVAAVSESIEKPEEPVVVLEEKKVPPHSDLTDKVNNKLEIKDGLISRESTPTVMELGSLLLKNKQFNLQISGPLAEAEVLKTYYVNRWAINKSRILIQEGATLELHLSE